MPELAAVVFQFSDEEFETEALTENTTEFETETQSETTESESETATETETESETQPTTKPTKGVKTGDDTPIGDYAGLMAIAFAAFALLVVSEQKRRKSGRE